MLLQSEKNRRLLRFGMVGGTNTVIDFGILFALTVAGLPTIAANIVSTTIAFVFSFVANKNYTFKSKSVNIKKQFILFTLVTLFGLWVIQNIVIALTEPILLSAGLSGSASLFIAKSIATVVSLVWNYYFYSRAVFNT